VPLPIAKDSLKHIMFEAINNLVNSLDARFAEMPKLQWVNLLYHANFAIYKGDFNEMQQLAELRNSTWPGVVDIVLIH